MHVRSLCRFMLVPMLGLLALGCSSSGDDSTDSSSVVDGDIVQDGDSDLDSEADAESADADSQTPTCDDTLPARPVPETPDTTFAVGPYLMNAQKTAMTVMWSTAEEAPGKVLYGEGDTLDKESAATGAVVVHEITLTDLKPGTRYAYKAVSGDTESGVHHFYTAPDDTTPVRFTVVADSHGVRDIYDPIIKQIRAFEPFFAIHAGDTTMDGSQLDTVAPLMFEPMRAIAHDVPWFFAIGNHERESQRWYDLVSYFMPGTPAPNKDFESSYSFRYGNTFVLVYDTNVVFWEIAGEGTYLSDFIKSAMSSEAAQTATWRIAVAHEPGYTEEWGGCFNDDGSIHYDGQPNVRDWVFPLLQQNHFHAYFNGHVHAYQRGHLDGGLTMFTTGGGGGDLDSFCQDLPQMTVTRNVHHHLEVEAGCSQFKVRAIDQEGTVIDYVTLDASQYGKIVDAGPDDTTNPPIEGTTKRR